MSGTGAGRKVYIADEFVPNSDLTKSGFEALTFVEIVNVGNTGEAGVSASFPTYSFLNKPVAEKGKGVTTTGDMSIEMIPLPTDPGQMAIAAAALTRKSYAFKIEEDDAPDEDTTNTITYHRGVVGGPTEGLGGADDFRTLTYTVGLQQLPVRVAPTAIP